jgi:cytochrome c oxidase subunit 4
MANTTTHARPNYIGIFILLAVLTGLELGVAFIGLSRRTVIVVLLLMAIYKAALVAMYFMHLKFETNRLRLLAVAPLPLAVIMIAAVITEYVW